MSSNKRIYLFTSKDKDVLQTCKNIETEMAPSGFEFVSNHEDADIIASVGGDGSFLQACRKTNFNKDKIYIGIKTRLDQNYLYVDFSVDDIPHLIESIDSNDVLVRKYPVLEVNLNNQMSYMCLNDFYIKSSVIKPMKMEIYIDDEYFEAFNGDGLLISTPTGSTGYNKSLDGAIIDPKLRSMQLTEIASLNNNNFRTVSSSVVLGDTRTLKIELDKEGNYYPIMGLDNEALSIQEVEFVSLQIKDKFIRTLKLPQNSFWSKVQRKFL
ncbi:NAD kinase [Mammaliicoccus stepanovicii]|uniref:NAD kinase n=1 Tax=Mammaliicoccus stepanovicii TaxID=643214 RepID=A0A239Z1F3_9STAP|nr:NAD kinase [Mammaliicoccus stepanovicii]PNZ78871.1 NAD kinase [Mammaliicoccus stepanovicii]GGI40381.1 NAD kinase 2 [Mammaliicoccus stepanovicii]SNV64476.1 inorganic polyphosphate/ATP-NAD kinase [Mammaliicoccus stepanovicii]